MLIIDKNTDYYDHLGKIYGVDKNIVYDRRGSVALSEKDLLVIADNSHPFGNPRDSYIIVEIGYTQYLFSVSDFKYRKIYSAFNDIEEPYAATFKLIKTFKDQKHYGEASMSLIPVEKEYRGWRTFNKVPTSYSELKKRGGPVLNPILKDTSFTSLLSQQDIWVDLSNYISSKYNDKTITIKNTDVDKLVNHGFDKRTSFRHPVK